MGRAHHIARREGSRSHSSARSRPHFVVFPTHANAPAAGPASASVAPVVAENKPALIPPANLSLPQRAIGSESPEYSPHFSLVPSDQLSGSSSRSMIMSANPHEVSTENRSSASHSPMRQDRAGPSDLQSISESWKSRWNAMSMKYKETISKSSRGWWKERLFSRNNSIAEIGSEVRREVNAGIASVSRMMERLETRENSRDGPVSASNNPVESSATGQSNRDNVETHQGTPHNETPAFLGTTSVSR